jgi:2'-5' RNA ligase/8-oxo-dGTP pyrophosphatase MutT (NUDIX family)
MPRLGVVALLPEPVAAHVQAWRRALREPSRDAVAPHLTLVPPQRVPEERVGDAAALVERAAAGVAPTVVELDGAGSFLPRSPVAYLRVGRGAAALARLERRLRSSPLERRTHPFHPHVTVAQELPAADIERAVGDLAGFRATFPLDHIWLMAETRAAGGGRVWRGRQRARLATGGVPGVTEAPLTDAVAASAFLLERQAAGALERQAAGALERQAAGAVDADRVLLGQRTPNPGRRHPGAWDALGGKPEPGEPLLSALARELREEAAVEPLDIATLGCWHDGDRADAYYVCTGWLGRPRNADPGEHTRIEWVPLAAATARTLPPSTRAALLRLRTLLGSACLPG